MAAALGAAAASGLADDAPKFRKGMWEFDSTLAINGKQLHKKQSRCTDPTQDMQDFMEAGKLFNCKWGKAVRSGNRYTKTSVCEGGAHKSMLRIVNSDSSYDEVNEDFTSSKSVMKETVHARRTGDCRK